MTSCDYSVMCKCCAGPIVESTASLWLACGCVYHKRCIEHYAEVAQTTLEELPCPNCKLTAAACKIKLDNLLGAPDQSEAMAAGEGDAAFARDETQTMAAGHGGARDNIMQLGAALPASAAGGGEGQQAAGGGQSEAMLPNAATTPGADEMDLSLIHI